MDVHLAVLMVFQMAAWLVDKKVGSLVRMKVVW